MWTMVVCAGQVSEDGLATPLREAGFTVHVVGGADEAAEAGCETRHPPGSRGGGRAVGRRSRIAI